MFKKIVLASDIKDRFKELTEEFDGRIGVLNFSINVQSHCEMDAIAHDIKELKTVRLISFLNPNLGLQVWFYYNPVSTKSDLSPLC